MLSRLRNELGDFLQMILLPSIAAVLPWSFCFRVFRWICRFDLLYRHETHEALAHAKALGWVKMSDRAWMQQSRVTTLIDHADFFLSKTRSRRWMARHLQVEGSWPSPSEPALLCTFHWGAGMWALRHAGLHKLNAHAIVAPHLRKNFEGRWVRYVYFGARNKENTRALGTQPIPASTSPRKILEVLRSRQQIMAAMDVPSDQSAANEDITIVGHKAKVPRGLFRVSVQSEIPMWVFITGFRMQDGRRTLSIHAMPQGLGTPQLMQQAFSLLEVAIVECPPAWHFWKVAPRFFTTEDE